MIKTINVESEIIFGFLGIELLTLNNFLYEILMGVPKRGGGF